MGDPTGWEKVVRKIDLLHQPLWQIDMTHDLLKQELFPRHNYRQEKKPFPKSVSVCFC